MKQGDLPYNIINSMGNQFWFYGAVLKVIEKWGIGMLNLICFPAMVSHQCTTLRDGEDEPEYDPRHDKVTAVIDKLEVLQVEAEIHESCELAL